MSKKNKEKEGFKPRFSLGSVVWTPGSMRAFAKNKQSPIEFLERHVQGDWGELCDEDKAGNEFAVKNDLRIISAYSLKDRTKIWIITEADRSATTVLLPEEY